MRGAGVIEFQNVRDTGFDFVLRPRIRPNIYFGWLIHEDEIWVDGVLRDDREGLRVQHGGQAGGEDAWIGVDPDNVQDGLKQYGGTTDAMLKVAKTSL